MLEKSDMVRWISYNEVKNRIDNGTHARHIPPYKKGRSFLPSEKKETHTHAKQCINVWKVKEIEEN